MVKVLIVGIVIFIVFAVIAQKYKNVDPKPQIYKVFYILHIVFGALFLIAVVVHGSIKLQEAPVWMIGTGVTTIALLIVQMVIGLFLQKKKNKALQVIHSILPIAITVLAISHIILAKVI